MDITALTTLLQALEHRRETEERQREERYTALIERVEHMEKKLDFLVDMHMQRMDQLQEEPCRCHFPKETSGQQSPTEDKEDNRYTEIKKVFFNYTEPCPHMSYQIPVSKVTPYSFFRNDPRCTSFSASLTMDRSGCMRLSPPPVPSYTERPNVLPISTLVDSRNNLQYEREQQPPFMDCPSPRQGWTLMQDTDTPLSLLSVNHEELERSPSGFSISQEKDDLNFSPNGGGSSWMKEKRYLAEGFDVHGTLSAQKPRCLGALDVQALPDIGGCMPLCSIASVPQCFSILSASRATRLGALMPRGFSSLCSSTFGATLKGKLPATKKGEEVWRPPTPAAVSLPEIVGEVQRPAPTAALSLPEIVGEVQRPAPTAAVSLPEIVGERNHPDIYTGKPDGDRPWSSSSHALLSSIPIATSKAQFYSSSLAEADYIADTITPLFNVDHPSFCIFVEALDPSYNVPCCKTLSTMKSDHDFILDWKLYDVLLSSKRFKGHHTRENISVAFEETITNVITDKASNMKKAYFRLPGFEEILLTLRGMEKSLPPSTPSRQPISTDLLLRLITSLRQGCFNPFDDIVMETLCLTAFFGFLRCSEFSTPSTSSFPALGLKRSDLSQIPGNHFILHIRSSKTDQLSQARRGRCVSVDCLPTMAEQNHGGYQLSGNRLHGQVLK
ncbi:UNVERIFIED_CONTAM: hypothetical protein FKN15_056141 [Acipenser sinensis]